MNAELRKLLLGKKLFAIAIYVKESIFIEKSFLKKKIVELREFVE